MFSFFKKIAAPPGAVSAAEARLAADAERARQRDLARATAAKIDAIEAAMVFDIFNVPEPAWGRPRARPAAAPRPSVADPPA